MSSLGGSTAAGLAAGSTPGRAAGGTSGAGATGGGTAHEPDGGVSLLGRLVRGPLPAHGHTDPDTGGVIDYAHLVVSATEPPAPATPSDAFWLNPTETA